MRPQLLLLLVTLCGANACARGQGVDVDASILKDVASQFRANMAAIKTWSGEVTVVDEQTTASTDLRRRESHVTFVYRAGPKAVRWIWDTLPPAQPEERFAAISASSGLIKNGKQFVVETRDVAPMRQIARVSDANAPGASGAALSALKLDPMDFFRDQNQIEFAESVELIRNQVPVHWRIRRNKDYLMISRRSPEGAAHVYRFTLDLAKGANVIRFESKSENPGPAARTLWSWTYEKNGDAWVPSEVDITEENLRPLNVNAGGQAIGKSAHRHLKWEKSVVNEPVEESEFSLEKIGIPKDGPVNENTKVGGAFIIRRDAGK